MNPLPQKSWCSAKNISEVGGNKMAAMTKGKREVLSFGFFYSKTKTN